MNPRILLVLCKQEYERRRVLKDALAAAPRPIEVSDATTSEEAQAKAKAERYDLIVAGYWLAGGPRKPVQPGGGLAFCEEVRARYKTPLLLVLPEAPIEGIVARCIAQLPEIAWTISGPDLAEQLIGIVLGAPSHAPLNIEIHTTPDEQWRYRLHGVAYPKGGDGPLELNPQFLDMARSLSRSIPAFGEDWYTEFERLGCNLKDALYSQRNQKFRRQLDVGLSRSNGIENTRVTFVVEDSNYDLALEAVQPPASPPVPWMVRAPLFRKVAGAPAASAEPFREEKPLKVLVVCADTSGYVNSRVDSKGRALKYKYPEFVRLECEIVQRLFSRRGQVHVVERLPAESPGAVDAGELKRRLEARWDIIHIAGHASYSARENRGYLVIGPPGKPVELDFADISPFLRRTGLLYLSCCESATAPFAALAAKEGVTAAVGYRWPVPDQWSVIHAYLFYRNLLKHRSIEKAFLVTRRVMHRRYEKKRLIWAASVLLKGGH